MDLNVCPNCNSFVGRDWAECRSCHQPLPQSSPDPEPQANETPEAEAPTTESSDNVASHSATEENQGPVAAEPSKGNDPEPAETSPWDQTESAEAKADEDTSAKNDEPGSIGSGLEWPKDERFTPGRIAITVGAVALAALVVIAALAMIFTAQDPPAMTSQETTTTTLVAVDFVAPDNSFSARFPSAPTRTELGTANGATYQATNTQEQIVAKVTVSQLPIGANQQDDEFLRTTLNGFAGASSLEVESSVIVRDSDPWKIDATMTDATRRINYRAFTFNGNLYQLSVEAPNNSETAPRVFSTLVDSFESRSGS